MFGWLSYNNSSQSAPINPAEVAKYNADDYVGSDACKDCHEDQFKNFSHTHHTRELEKQSDRLRIVPRSRQSPHRRGRSEEDHFFQEQIAEGNFRDMFGLSRGQRGAQQLPSRRTLA
jgi:hypothetical protein